MLFLTTIKFVILKAYKNNNNMKHYFLTGLFLFISLITFTQITTKTTRSFKKERYSTNLESRKAYNSVYQARGWKLFTGF